MAEDLPTRPTLNEIAAVNGDDIGFLFVADLAESNDEIVRARGGDLRVYDKVLRDEQVQSCFKQLRTAIIAREWHVEPGGPEKLDEEAGADLQRNLDRVSFDTITRKMATGLWNGYGVGECMWGTAYAKVTLETILVRKARRFKFDRTGRLRLVRGANLAGQLMPEAKFWVLRADADDDDDPYPLGLGHYCYWPVWFKRNMLRYWALWGEKFAAPTALGKLPPGAKEEERNKLLGLLDAIIRGGKIVVPTNVGVELLEALRRAGDDYLKFCKYLDGAIAKILLSQTMTTDDGSSLSQAQVHADVKIEVVKTYSDLICESFNRGPATWLAAWNYPGAAPPRVWRDFSEPEDLSARAKVDLDLTSVGYRPTAKRVAEVYGEGYEPVTPPQGQTDVSPQSESTDVGFAEEGEAVADVASGIEAAVGGDRWERLISPQVAAAEDAIARAATLEEAKRILAEFAAEDPTELVESLARAMFAARIGGVAGAEVDAD